MFEHAIRMRLLALFSCGPKQTLLPFLPKRSSMAAFEQSHPITRSAFGRTSKFHTRKVFESMCQSRIMGSSQQEASWRVWFFLRFYSDVDRVCKILTVLSRNKLSINSFNTSTGTFLTLSAVIYWKSCFAPNASLRSLVQSDWSKYHWSLGLVIVNSFTVQNCSPNSPSSSLVCIRYICSKGAAWTTIPTTSPCFG